MELVTVGILLIFGLGIRSDILANDNFATYHNPLTCVRVHPDKESKLQPGDGGFQLVIENIHDNKYSPFKQYSIYLRSFTRKFTEFTIIAESESHDASDTGKFEVYEKTLSEFSVNCPNTIIQKSMVPKHQIMVYWKAPGIDSGCVAIKATVVNTTGALFSDKGNLTLRLCQGELGSNIRREILERCDACTEANYELTFEAIWSKQTHPKDFPIDAFSTNFSTVFGATHTTDYRMWEIGQLASPGIVELAETGSITTLEGEIKHDSSKIRTVIKTKGLKVHPHLNERTFSIFRTDNSHHLLSIISKFSPSPDWVVGFPALELCLNNKSWIDKLVINLFPIDIGTLEGHTYEVPKEKTIPVVVIKTINSTSPHFEETPFYYKDGDLMPLAKVIIKRQRIFQKVCNFSDDYVSSSPDNCDVTEWETYRPCSVTCGRGTKVLARNYVNPHMTYNRCKINLYETQQCIMSECFTHINKNQECNVTEWSTWSPCFHGNTYRFRSYLNPEENKFCTMLLKEKRKCIESDTKSLKCDVTQWSKWSPCSCVDNIQYRERQFVNEDSYSNCDIELRQSISCYPDEERCTDFPKKVVPCELTEWSEWSSCTKTCGNGRKTRRRMIVQNAGIGADPCPETVQTRKCKHLPPCYSF